MTKLVFFDMDGTLSGMHSTDSVGSTLWSKIALELDVYEEKSKIDNQFYSNKIKTYSDWVNETMSLYDKNGLTESIFYDILSRVSYNNGVPQALKRIHDNGITTVVITGGFKAQADDVRERFDIDSSVAACECKWDEAEKLSGLNIIPLGKFGKMRLVETYTNGYKTTPAQSVYVGDGENDSIALDECGLGISYNGRESAVNNADVDIRGTNNKEFHLIADEVLEFFE